MIFDHEGEMTGIGLVRLICSKPSLQDDRQCLRGRLSRNNLATLRSACGWRFPQSRIGRRGTPVCQAPPLANRVSVVKTRNAVVRQILFILAFCNKPYAGREVRMSCSRFIFPCRPHHARSADVRCDREAKGAYAGKIGRSSRGRRRSSGRANRGGR